MKNKIFEIVLDKLDQLIIIIDKDKKILFMNEKAKIETNWLEGVKIPNCNGCGYKHQKLENKNCLMEDEQGKIFYAELPILDKKQLFSVKNTKISEGMESYYLLSLSKIDDKDSLNKDRLDVGKISKELHDTISPNIYSIYLGLDILKDKAIPNDLMDTINLIKNISKKTLNDIRILNHWLSSEKLMKNNIEETLLFATYEWEKLFNLPIDLSIQLINSEKLSTELQLNLYKIIQESVMNALKHSYLKFLKIKVQQKNEKVFFEVTSFGQFKKDSTSHFGLGIVHMKERCERFNGELKVIEEKNKKSFTIKGYLNSKIGDQKVNECINCR